ncbi:LysR family transcriptional regulator [Pseudomonas syringae]|nr:LysR family transcriptional regulator [Pseudomonas syringae]
MILKKYERIELKLLRQNVVVAETLNFREAAQRLKMPQPPLSVAIRRLEDCLGVQLLLRSTRPTQVTAAGVVLLAEARQTLLQAERACEKAPRSGGGMLGPCSLGCVERGAGIFVRALLRW